MSEGSWPSEVSWTISDGNGNVLLSGELLMLVALVQKIVVRYLVVWIRQP